MTVSPIPADRAAFAVLPVVDYEPPPRDVRQCPPLSATTLRRRNTHGPQRLSGHPPVVGQVPSTSVPMPRAASFADAALRRVLEVIDHRRPVAQLQGLLASGLVDSVLAINRVAACRLAADDGAAAVLRRLRLQAIGPHDRPAAAEVFGTYSRGRRIHAIACRVEQVDARWQVVALHIG